MSFLPQVLFVTPDIFGSPYTVLQGSFEPLLFLACFVKSPDTRITMHIALRPKEALQGL